VSIGAAKIAACMMVKDAEPTIAMCLDSIRPFVDEVNVYDTGSTDKTLRIIRGLNVDRDRSLGPVRVKRGEWRDDFAWAREQSFAMASPDVDWLLWLDDDDVVVGGEYLHWLADSCPPDVDGFVFKYEYEHDENGQCVRELWRERLIRRSAGLRWRGAAHDVLVPPKGRRCKLQMVPAELVRYVHHRQPGRPTDANLRILLREKREAESRGERPDGRTIVYTCLELLQRQQLAEATETLTQFFERYLTSEGASRADERIRVAWTYIAAGRSTEALTYLEAAISVDLDRLGLDDESLTIANAEKALDHFASMAPTMDRGVALSTERPLCGSGNRQDGTRPDS
jgi:hypothetical protein